MLEFERLIIFSGVPHFDHGEVIAHAGFVREIDIWSSIFEQVLLVVPFSERIPPADAVPYKNKNVQFMSLGEPFVSDGLVGKVKLMVSAITWIWKLLPIIKPSDILMARGPDGIGFLGWLFSRLKGNPRIAKYADQWMNYPNEPLGYRLQKAFYRSPKFGGPVMIYGNNDPARPHLIPLFPSSLTMSEWQEAGTSRNLRPVNPPYNLLFVGRFVFDKGLDVLLQAYKQLLVENMQVELTVVGDGPLNTDIRNLVQKLELEKKIRFTGWIGWDELSKIYCNSHLYIHCARKEGFGKVLLEAMAYSLPIVGTEVGISSSLVKDTNSGILIQPGDPIILANTIKNVLADQEKLTKMGSNGRKEVKNLVWENLQEQYFAIVQLAIKRK